MLRSNDPHRGAHCLYFAKDMIIDWSVKRRRYRMSWVVWLHI
jgi:hypothetical protein